MQDGIILFPPPDDSSLKRRTVFENQQVKRFVIGENMAPVDQEGSDE